MIEKVESWSAICDWPVTDGDVQRCAVVAEGYNDWTIFGDSGGAHDAAINSEWAWDKATDKVFCGLHPRVLVSEDGEVPQPGELPGEPYLLVDEENESAVVIWPVRGERADRIGGALC